MCNEHVLVSTLPSKKLCRVTTGPGTGYQNQTAAEFRGLSVTYSSHRGPGRPPRRGSSSGTERGFEQVILINNGRYGSGLVGLQTRM